MFLRSILGLYSWEMPASLVSTLHANGYSGGKLLRWFWRTNTFKAIATLSDVEHSLVVLLWLGMLAQISVGVALLIDWARFGTAGTWEFGAALLLSYPIVWAHIVIVLALGWKLAYYTLHPKKCGRDMVCAVLEWQVRRLRRRNNFKVVAVVGSLGKTSTKTAIANLLGQTLRVRYQAGNYNDRVTVPLVFFGQREPSLFNVFNWLNVFGANNAQIAFPYPYDVVVVELGTDGPGFIEEFAYLKPDLTVVTAVAEEHMEFFKTLDAVAAEELTVFDYSKQVLVNADDIAGVYLAGRKFVEYSLTSKQASYGVLKRKSNGLAGQTLTISTPGGTVTVDVVYLGIQGAKFALAAAAVADMLGVKLSAIEKGLPELKPFSGRMQMLPGIHGSTLIDDTYNAAPISVKAALDVLYSARTSQRIAILGSMNELGDYSQEAHETVGAYCDPKKLDVVVTVGAMAKKWLAPEARAKGCEVRSFMSPYEAGEFLQGKVRKGAVVLAKGSQNGVFTEEAIKLLLAHPEDAEKLVRQSTWWLARKAKQFPPR
jgi:UDP-N-acetylmuramoyl-tripeptide--D-alanyl-D-alanine ligase